MAPKWFVQSGTEVFGPWSSSRIRDELRSGGIDPFDLAYLEGSSVKRALIEIDDLFESSSVQPAAIIQDEPRACNETVYGQETKENELPRPFSISKSEVKPEDFLGASFYADQNAADIPAKEVVNQSNRPIREDQIAGRQKFTETILRGALQSQTDAEFHKIEKRSAPVPDASSAAENQFQAEARPRAFEALASPDRVTTPKTTNVARVATARGSKRTGPGTVKKYHVFVPGMKMQGPFNSRDLLTLWYAKKLPLNTLIQRTGSPKRIEIQRFVLFYERAEPSGVAFIGEAKLAGASDRSLLWLFLAVFAAVGIIVGALLWKGIRSAKNETIILGSGPLHSDRENIPASSHATANQLNTNLKPTNSLRENSIPSDTIPPKSVRQSRAKNRKPAASLKVNETAAQRNKYRSNRPYVTRPNSYTNTARPGYSTKSTPTVPRSVPTIRKPSTASAGVGFIDGAIVSLSGYKFNSGALASCDGKCKISMNGPRGPVTVVYFKEAFGSSFTGKSESSAFTGMVRKDAASGVVSILVKSVP